MSDFNGANVISGVGTEAITAYRFLKTGTTAEGTLKYTMADAGEKPVGISADATLASGDVVPVAVYGRGRLEVNGATVNIAVGDALAPTTNGVGVKADMDDYVGAVALEPATADGVRIAVDIVRMARVSNTGTAITDATASITLTAAQLKTGKRVQLTASYAGAVALAIPGAADVPDGHELYLLKTGSAGAITVTPASGSVNDAATYASVDATNDYAILRSDGIGNWAVVSANIA